MRLNLGCGNKKLDGFVNCDSQPACNPDRLMDLEALPWPFEDNSVDEVVLSHVLEHLGESSKVYLGIIKELYRICRHDAIIRIAVPHPRHDDFLIDPTHVRPILPDQFAMYSKRLTQEWREKGYANSSLADYLDVDFEVDDVQWVPDDRWVAKLRSGEIKSDVLASMAQHQNNILREIRIVMRAKKPG